MRPVMFCLALSLIMAVLPSRAQVTPVVAKQRIVHDELDLSGNVLRHTETLGRYLRNSVGSTITQEYTTIEGKTAIRSGQLEDYGRHKVYVLSYERRQAVEQRDLTDDPHPEYLASTTTALGEDTVNGLPCIVHSIFMEVEGQERQIGRTCDSAEHGLTIKEDAILRLPGAPPTRRIIELYDIQFVEPDPSEFALEGFSFLEKRPAACTKPGAAAPLKPLK